MEVLRLVTGVTLVDTRWLVDLAPRLFATKPGRLIYDPRLGALAQRQQIRFGKRVIEGGSVAVTEETSANRKAFIREYAKWAHSQLERQQRAISRFGNRVPRITLRQVEQEVGAVSGAIISIEQLEPEVKKRLLRLSKLEAYLGDDFLSPDGQTDRQGAFRHKRRRGWTGRANKRYNKPKNKRWRG